MSQSDTLTLLSELSLGKLTHSHACDSTLVISIQISTQTPIFPVLPRTNELQTSWAVRMCGRNAYLMALLMFISCSKTITKTYAMERHTIRTLPYSSVSQVQIFPLCSLSPAAGLQASMLTDRTATLRGSRSACTMRLGNIVHSFIQLTFIRCGDAPSSTAQPFFLRSYKWEKQTHKQVLETHGVKSSDRASPRTF